MLLKNLFFEAYLRQTYEGPVTKEQQTDAIYPIPCNDCDNEYIGQTKRQFGTRLKELPKKGSSFAKKKIQLYRSTHA